MFPLADVNSAASKPSEADPRVSVMSPDSGAHVFCLTPLSLAAGGQQPEARGREIA